MPAATTTRLTIKQDALRVLSKRDEALAVLPIPLRTTAAGSTTTLTDTKLGRGTTQANRYDGRAVEIISMLSSTTIVSSSVANPSVITATAHGLTVSGQIVIISGHVGSTPDINGEHVITYVGADTFTIPVSVTVGGTGGTVTEKADHVGVDDAGFNGTSIVTFSPAVIVAPPTANPYLIYPQGLAGEMLEELIDEVLRDTTGPYIHFPTLVPDGDLSEALVGNVGNWWNNISNALTTKEYVLTSTNQWNTQQIFGARSLHAKESGTSTGIKSDPFYVGDTEAFVASFFVQALAGTLTVLVYDETNSATIGTAVTIDEPGWKEVRFTEAVPAACESVSVSFSATATTGEYYVSAPLIFQVTTRTRPYDMPSWFVSESQIRQALFLPLGVSSEDAGSYVALSAALKPVVAPRPTFLNEARGVNPFKIVLQATADGPMALLVERPFDVLSVNASTTTADREYMRSKVIATVLRDWGDSAYKTWAQRASERAQAMGYNLREMRVEPNQVVSV